MSSRVERIRERIDAALQPMLLEIEDQSQRHAGHEGARDGRGHFAVHVVSASFEGLPMLARHRRVFAAVGDLMQTDIHALALRTEAPSERSPR